MKTVSMWDALIGVAILVCVIACMRLALLVSQPRAVRSALPIGIAWSALRSRLPSHNKNQGQVRNHGEASV